MAEIVQGLFGVSPESLNAQREAALNKQAMDYAGLDPFERANYGIYKGASQLGTGVAGLMGAQDPEMQRSIQRQQLLKTADTGSVQGLQSLATALQQANDPQGAMQALQKAQELAKSQGALSAQATETALKQAQITEIPGQIELRKAQAAKAGFDQLSEEQAQAATKAALIAEGMPPAQVEAIIKNPTARASYFSKVVDKTQVTEADGRVILIDKATGSVVADLGKAADKSTKVNVTSVTKGEDEYAKQFLGGMATQDLALKTAAESAPASLENIQATRNILKSGNVFTGTGAGLKLNVLAFGQALGATGATENEIIANTQQLQQQRSTAVINKIKGSGLGSGQGFTDKDLTFLQDASAGRITLSPDTIKRQLDIEEKVEKAIALKWNNRVSKINPSIAQSAGLSPVQISTNEVPSPNRSALIPGQASQPAQAPVYATNPTTKQRIVSTDGGATWTPAR